jgi:hypothetical protein
VIVGVVVLAGFVREPTEAEPREILDGEVAVVDHERELVVVRGRRDLAHRLGGGLELATARADHPAQVDRRRVHPRLLRDRDQLAFGVGELAGVVRRTAAQIRALAGRGHRDRIGVLDRLDPGEHALVIAGLDRDVDGAPVRRAVVGSARAALEHDLECVERRTVRARAGERDAEVELGVLVLDEVGEPGVARRLDDRVERDRGRRVRAILEEILGRLELAPQRVDVAAVDIDQLHGLECAEVLADAVEARGGRRLVLRGRLRLVGLRGGDLSDQEEPDQRERAQLHFFPFAGASPGRAIDLTETSSPRP